MRGLLFLTAALLFGSALGAQAQTKPAVPLPPPLPGSIATHPNWPAAKNAGDVESIEHIVAALYDVISGPSTKQRDWDRFRSLFLPDGRLAPVRPDVPATADKPARKSDVVLLTPDMYAERDDPYFKREGFFEHGVVNRVEEFGNLAHVWSMYESRHAESDAKPFARGINSIQVVHAQGRYWIASIMWDDERPGLVMPEKYLRP